MRSNTLVFAISLLLTLGGRAEACGVGADVHVVKGGKRVRLLHSSTAPHATDTRRGRLYRFDRTKTHRQLVAQDLHGKELWRVEVDMSRPTGSCPCRVRIGCWSDPTRRCSCSTSGTAVAWDASRSP